MASVAGGEQLFSRGSPVHAYWLANSEGFALGRGRVEAVVREPEEPPVALVVRSGLFRRRRLVDAEAVAAVDPAARVLLVERRPRSRPRLHLVPAVSFVLALAPALLRLAAAAVGRGREWTRPRADATLRSAREASSTACASGARTARSASARASRRLALLRAGAAPALQLVRETAVVSCAIGVASARSALAFAERWLAAVDARLRPLLADAAAAARARLHPPRRSRQGRRAPG